VIDAADQFACPQGGVRPAGDYLRLSEAALAVGLEESDLLFLVRRHKVRLLRIRKNIYFRLAELREDLGSQIVPTAHLDGGISRGRQRRESHARKTAENAGQIQAPAGGGM